MSDRPKLADIIDACIGSVAGDGSTAGSNAAILKVALRIVEVERDTLTSRCEALKADNAQSYAQLQWVGECIDGHDVSAFAESFPLVRAVAGLRVRCEALTAERDTLRQKLSDADEIRVSFAAGYTAALDDALKGTK